LLRFHPWAEAHKLAPRPLLVVHGAENELHKVDEAQRLYDSALEPKQLVLLEGKGHTEWMFDDDPTFKHVAKLVEEFFSESFSGILAAS
jgi:uncharacterized protein